MEQASVCDPERLEQQRDLRVQQDELCWHLCIQKDVCNGGIVES